MSSYINIGKSIPKVDALALAAGTGQFTDDFRVENELSCAVLYSPVAHAEIVSIDATEAYALAGVVDVLHYQNVPRVLHTTAGQGFPEPSPYDTVLFDRKVRFVGDRIALVAAEDADTARRAADAIKVEYAPLPALFDMEKAKNHDASRLHTDDEHAKIPAVYDPGNNVAAEITMSFGDLEKGFKDADFIEDHTYNTQIVSHCAIEPHAVRAHFDEQGRLVLITSTQVPFHARRIVSMVCGIPLQHIRVIKPRIGGGFGGKQEVFLEPLAGLVTWRNRRPSRIVLSRKEVFVASRTRHEMRIRLRTGVKNDGRITALSMDVRLNAGAYGPHALTVLSNVGAKVLPLFNKIEHIHFYGESVYTNLPVGGAFRGYGATQGYFAFNQQIDMITAKTGQGILAYIKKWHIKEGETSPVFQALGEGKEGVKQSIRSCKLEECIDRGAKAIGWREKRGKHIITGKNRVRGVGMAVAMQGSGIAKIDMGSASMKMNEDGSFNLFVGATDIGTGSDTILSQIAAEVLAVPSEKIIVLSSDTDLTPFDVGAYASSTTYISGGAVQKCAQKLKMQIVEAAARILASESAHLRCENGTVRDEKTRKKIGYADIALHTMYSDEQFQIQAGASHTSSVSPPPFIAQFAEVEVDTETGSLKVVKFVSAVDCGQPINPVLVEGQIEGSVVQGLTYALTEDYIFDTRGKMVNSRFWDYKIFTAPDIPEIVTIIVPSEEQTGPFGAKSVGEIAINGPAPAVANALFDAIGIRVYNLPITREKVWRILKEEKRP